MGSMRAIVVDPSAARGRLALKEVARPDALPFEALVRVKAVSLNLGEVRRAQTAEPGWRPGWDLAGVVEQPAADGSGPPAGTRVVAIMGSGSWAEEAAVPTQSLAELPESVSFAEAATLPVAGLTALFALEKGGALLGRNVLVTGASGGVGIFACQLARHGGAHVVGLVRRSERARYAHEARAHEVVVGEDLGGAERFAPYDLILESVGGKVLAQALTMLKSGGGMCVLFGTSSGGQVTFDASRFYSTAGVSLFGFRLVDALLHTPGSVGLARLVRMLDMGVLRPRIEVQRPWQETATTAHELFHERKIAGKAVMLVE